MKHLPIQVGIDVAGPGEDETVLVACAGGAILESHFWSDPDPRGRVAQVLSRLRQTGRLQAVLVDAVGIGYNYALHLRDPGFPVFLFNAGHRPIDPLARAASRMVQCVAPGLAGDGALNGSAPASVVVLSISGKIPRGRNTIPPKTINATVSSVPSSDPNAATAGRPLADILLCLQGQAAERPRCRETTRCRLHPGRLSFAPGPAVANQR